MMEKRDMSSELGGAERHGVWADSKREASEGRWADLWKGTVGQFTPASSERTGPQTAGTGSQQAAPGLRPMEMSRTVRADAPTPETRRSGNSPGHQAPRKSAAQLVGAGNGRGVAGGACSAEDITVIHSCFMLSVVRLGEVVCVTTACPHNKHGEERFMFTAHACLYVVPSA